MLDEVELPLNNFIKQNSSQNLIGKGDIGTVFKHQEKETGTYRSFHPPLVLSYPERSR